MSTLKSDLVRDSRLPTTFVPEGIRHTRWRASRHRGRRRAREETWRRERELGSGSFGQVWLERSISDGSKGRVRALKAIRKDNLSPAVDYGRELEAAAKFSHDRYVDCFVQSYGWFEDERHVYLAMEYLEHGDLRNFLGTAIVEHEAQEITKQLVDGLVSMHENNFIHRDLKPANILVVEPGPYWWVKIADFGISKRAEEGSTACKTRIGTEGYCAPEVMGILPASASKAQRADESYTAAVDLWALGEVVFRMLTQRPAFRDTYEIFRFAEGHLSLDAQLQTLSTRGMSNDCSSLIEKLLVVQPDLRITAQEALQHPWLLLDASSSHSTSRSSTPSPSVIDSPDTVSTDPMDVTNIPKFEEPSAQWSTAAMDDNEKPTFMPDTVTTQKSHVLLSDTSQPVKPSELLGDSGSSAQRKTNLTHRPRAAMSSPTLSPVDHLGTKTGVIGFSEGFKADESTSHLAPNVPPYHKDSPPLAGPSHSRPVHDGALQAYVELPSEDSDARSSPEEVDPSSHFQSQSPRSSAGQDQYDTGLLAKERIPRIYSHNSFDSGHSTATGPKQDFAQALALDSDGQQPTVAPMSEDDYNRDLPTSRLSSYDSESRKRDPVGGEYGTTANNAAEARVASQASVNTPPPIQLSDSIGSGSQESVSQRLVPRFLHLRFYCTYRGCSKSDARSSRGYATHDLCYDHYTRRHGQVSQTGVKLSSKLPVPPGFVKRMFVQGGEHLGSSSEGKPDTEASSGDKKRKHRKRKAVRIDPVGTYI